MGGMFLVSFITGLVKFMILVRVPGLTGIVFPSAIMSTIHDWAGLFLGILVAAHLFLNRAWIMAMTRKILTGAPPH
jgi:hypothetical protein